MISAESRINEVVGVVFAACALLLVAALVPRRAFRTRPRPAVFATGSLLRLALSSLGLGLIATPTAAVRSRILLPLAAKSSSTTPPWLRTDAFSPPRDASVPTRVAPRVHPAIHGRRSAHSVEEPLFPRATRRSTHVVAAGDTLWSIAALHLRTDDPARIARYWPTIHRVNRAVVGPDPNSIFPGQVLALPPEHRNSA